MIIKHRQNDSQSSQWGVYYCSRWQAQIQVFNRHMPNNSSCLRHRWGDNFKDMTHFASIFQQLGNTIVLSTAINVEKKKNILEQFNRKIEMAKKQVFYKLFSFGKSPFQCQLIRYPSTLPLFHLQHMLYNKPALLCDGIAVTCWTKQATRHLRKTLKHQITGEHWAISIATNTRADYTTFYECHGDILHWSHRPYLQHQTDG